MIDKVDGRWLAYHPAGGSRCAAPSATPCVWISSDIAMTSPCGSTTRGRCIARTFTPSVWCPMLTDTAPEWFVHDVAIYNLAVEQYTLTVDGQKVISTACPQAVRDHYSKLLQHGYANGWLT